MRHRNIINELNRENSRSIWVPLLLLIVLTCSAWFVVPLIIIYANEIDGIYMSRENQLLIGWALTVIPFILIVRKIKNISK